MVVVTREDECVLIRLNYMQRRSVVRVINIRIMDKGIDIRLCTPLVVVSVESPPAVVVVVVEEEEVEGVTSLYCGSVREELPVVLFEPVPGATVVVLLRAHGSSNPNGGRGGYDGESGTGQEVLNRTPNPVAIEALIAR